MRCAPGVLQPVGFVGCQVTPHALRICSATLTSHGLPTQSWRCIWCTSLSHRLALSVLQCSQCAYFGAHAHFLHNRRCAPMRRQIRCFLCMRQSGAQREALRHAPIRYAFTPHNSALALIFPTPNPTPMRRQIGRCSLGPRNIVSQCGTGCLTTSSAPFRRACFRTLLVPAGQKLSATAAIAFGAS